MMHNDLNNKLKDFGNSLDEQLENSQNAVANAMKAINELKDPKLKKLSEEFIENAKAGNNINVDAFLKQALEYAGRNNS